MRIFKGKRWLLIAPAAVLALIVSGTWAYIHVIQGDAPAPLSLTNASSAVSTPDQGASTVGRDPGGLWRVTDGSTVGYRVNEVLFGQKSEAVGRTSDVTGSVTVKNVKLSAAEFVVDMTTVTSDQSRRDDQFNGRIMETATYPTASFKLTAPVEPKNPASPYAKIPPSDATNQ